MTITTAILAISITLNPVANGDTLEPSVENEVAHAISRAPKNAPYAVFDFGKGNATEIALKLVKSQRGDGRWFEGTNDITCAAVRRLREISGIVEIGEEAAEADFASMDIKGYAGERLERCVRNQMAVKDLAHLVFPFTQKTDNASWSDLQPGIWQTEFWGKYMHAAVPMCDRADDKAWRERLAAAVDILIGTQQKDGYIGNYSEKARCSSCDVWGAKYVMMGLLHWYDSEKADEPEAAERALKAAKGVADWVMLKFGPTGGRHSLGAEGPFNGLMNCSVLEPIVWLYRRTGERKYLDYAGWIVTELDVNKKGPEIFRFAESGTPLKDCKTADSGNKAYEKMSCLQGILDYFEETGDERLFVTVKKIAEQVIAEEIDISGGGTQGERFCGYRKMQTHDRTIASEMCVIITWMRLCEKLLTLTDDPKWADQIERTFYNAYLGGLSADGSAFSSYGGLGGIRERVHPEQCRMHANCCDSNGARGFLSFFKSAATSRDDTVFVNQYVFGHVIVPCKAAKGGSVVLDGFNDYPRKLRHAITLALEAPSEFTLSLRSPGWSGGTTVKSSQGDAKKLAGGGRIELRHLWKPGDQIVIEFEDKVEKHVLGDYAAFTRGPVTLARDARFGDGDFSECIELDGDAKPVFTASLPPENGMYMAVTAMLRTGVHYNHEKRPIGFCDFASAGNTDDRRSFYRVWLPIRK